ncbi:MAG: GMC family oxidoreductase [Myxococcales bacterium]|nr:GMC family oxidoreductase [Myxococcales bacterium]
MRPSGIFGREDFAKDSAHACDVLVIGSGAGGGVMAAELAEAGLDVIVLEEGGYHDTSEFTTDASAMIRKLYRDGGASMAMGDPPVIFSEGRTVGGSTVINGGMSWRTPEKILDRWRKEDGVEQISPADLEPHFARVERFISARGQDPESLGRDNELLREGAEAKGWKVVPNLRNQVHCAGTNNCAFGCPTAAKRSVLVTYVPRALAFGARVLSDVRVSRLTRRGKRITGAIGHVVRENGTRGAKVAVTARLTVVAAGAIQTPALLVSSGIRSPSGRIGQNLSLHPNVKLQAIFDENVEGWKGVHQAYQVREFQNEGLVFAAVNLPPSLLAMTAPAWGEDLARLMRDYHRIVNAGLLYEDTVTGRVRVAPGGRPFSFYQITDHDTEQLVRGMMLLAELLFAAGAKRIVSPFDGAPDLHSVDDARALAKQKVPRRALELFTVHMMGTCAMGNDPTRHVCDSFGKLHDADGLYVTDASLFPSPIGVNPMETIMALATRNAARILDSNAARRAQA